MKKLLLLFLFLASTLTLHAQTDSIRSSFSVSGYAEIYYLYDFNQPDNHTLPDFLFSFNRHNEFNLNFGFVQLDYQSQRVRGKLALMAGTYANANLAAEPGVLKNIFEANIGVKLSKEKNTWLDAGVFASHLGFESAIGADCWNLTRSLVAENSPYFLSGMKITHTSENGKWLVSGIVSNGWQRMQRLEGNQMPGFGHQLTWMPQEGVTLNSSSFFGSDTPAGADQLRFFHDFYGIFEISDRFGLIAGLDFGIEQRAPRRSNVDSWYGAAVIARFKLNEKLHLAGRAEYFQDESGIIIDTGTPNGFQTFGYSLNFDAAITENTLWRLEARAFSSSGDAIFLRDGTAVSGNVLVSTSLSMRFGK